MIVRIWLIAPYSSSNMFRQTVATMIGGMTTGRMYKARQKRFSQRPSVLSRTAIATPRMTWMTTLLSAHQRLKRMSRMKSKFGMARLLVRTLM